MKKFISPSLADLTQDIAGAVPVDIIQSWIASGGKEEDAEQILSRFKIRGTLVSSDTAGLSKMSKEKDLLEVLKIVSDPKEIIYGLGRHIDGKGVGRWVADNTQMFFPAEVEVHQVVDAIHEANQRILKDCKVKVGFCIHHDEFLNFGEGFYGDQADFMEEVAENHSDGGEVLITENVAKIVSEKGDYSFEEKKLEIETPQKVYSLKSAKGIPDAEIKERDYPIYFDQAFFNHLKEIENEGKREEIYRLYSKPKVVVLIQMKSDIESSGLAGLLDILIENSNFSAVLKKVNQGYGSLEIKIAGSFAIYALEIDQLERAIEFSGKIRTELKKASMNSIIGIDAGDVLLFPLENDTWDIAGDPVNIASKQAQDFGETGKIYITKKAAGDLEIKNAVKYEKEVSHVILEGWEF